MVSSELKVPSNRFFFLILDSGNYSQSISDDQELYGLQLTHGRYEMKMPCPMGSALALGKSKFSSFHDTWKKSCLRREVPIMTVLLSILPNFTRLLSGCLFFCLFVCFHRSRLHIAQFTPFPSAHPPCLILSNLIEVISWVSTSPTCFHPWRNQLLDRLSQNVILFIFNLEHLLLYSNVGFNKILEKSLALRSFFLLPWNECPLSKKTENHYRNEIVRSKYI